MGWPARGGSELSRNATRTTEVRTVAPAAHRNIRLFVVSGTVTLKRDVFRHQSAIRLRRDGFAGQVVVRCGDPWTTTP